MKTGSVMAGLALTGPAAAWPGAWHRSSRLAAVRLWVRVGATAAQLREALGVSEPEGFPRAWRRFQDRIERELKELDERLRRLEKYPEVDRTSEQGRRPVGSGPPGKGGC